MLDLGRLPPQLPGLGEGRVPVGPLHRAQSVRSRVGRGEEPVLDQFLGDQRLVVDQRAQERGHLLARRPGRRAELHQPPDALARPRREQAHGQRRPGTHQHQPVRPVGEVEREPHHDRGAERVPDQVHLVQALVVQEPGQHGRGPAQVVPVVFGRAFGAAEARLVDKERAEVLAVGRQVAGEVAPGRHAGPGAVQHDQGIAGAGLVVVHGQAADLRAAAGLFVAQ